MMDQFYGYHQPRRKQSFKDILSTLGLGLLPAAGTVGGTLLAGPAGGAIGGSLAGLLGAGLEGLRPQQEQQRLTYKGYPLSAYKNLQLTPEASEYYGLQQQPESLYSQFPVEDIAGGLGQLGIQELINYVTKRNESQKQVKVHKNVREKIKSRPDIQDAIARMILAQRLGLR